MTSCAELALATGTLTGMAEVKKEIQEKSYWVLDSHQPRKNIQLITDVSSSVLGQATMANVPQIHYTLYN